MNKIIIATCGIKESGKTTACNAIMSEFKNLGVEKMSFASPIKNAARLIFDFSEEQLYGSLKEVIDERHGITPRFAMQVLGTEIGRNFYEDIWVDNLFRSINKSYANIILIDDCRFLNESKKLKEYGAYILGIKKTGQQPSNHQSEKEMFDNWELMVHDTLFNDNTIDSFRSEVISWARQLIY